MPQIGKIIILCIIVLAAGIYMGAGAATDSRGTVIQAVAIGGILACMMMGHRIWLLVPILGSFSVPIIRGFDTGQLAQMLFIGFSVLLFCMRRLPVKFKFSELEFWGFMVALMIAQVYLRNPAGLNIFGADTVGARPYFVAVLAFITMIIMANLMINPKDFRIAMWGSWIFGMLGGIAGETRRGGFGGGGDTPDYSNVGRYQYGGGAGRIGFLAPIAVGLARMVVAYTSPLKALFHPLWGAMLLLSIIAGGMTGFRNVIAMVCMVYLAGILYHGGMRAMFMSVFLGAIGLVFLGIINLNFPLPPNMQRALTPLPGTWEERFRDDAEGQNEWRIQIWKAALFTDDWIQNKWFGDGLGMSRIELERSKFLKEGGSGGAGWGNLNPHQVNILVSGDYHSGPVQTIRTVGYFGLVVLLIAMWRVAVHSHRLIVRARGTPWQALALYMCIPRIVAPFYFLLVIGWFGVAATTLFLGIAGTRMMERNLPLPAYIPRKARTWVPLAVRRLTGSEEPEPSASAGRPAFR